ncbi:glycosyltransferase family protein [Kitasatospora purpeofusca]|uniref:glycosyltransferase family protein n=1 Tax=Kitasatospora purpeofusca TaxID=67352 RepID=UPI003669F3A9
MRIGYSFWGFLGSGVTDTPDGGRSHRRTLLDGLTVRGHDVVLLQADRDLLEAGTDLTTSYEWDGSLPEIDALFLEWRWPIPGRNTTRCGSEGHTCDLHRQQELLDHYTHHHGVRTLIWDKDLQLPADSSLRALCHVQVCEAALHPSPGTQSLLFPVDDDALDRAHPAALAAHGRPVPLVYIGNQYHRDSSFDRYFSPAAARLPHRVAGKWTDTARWPDVNFTGRIPFDEVAPLYAASVATVLLAPERYARSGQFTQRIFESVLAGCLPLAPATLRGAEAVVPRELVVTSGPDVLATVTALTRITGSQAHADLIARCIDGLDRFRLTRQLRTVDRVLSGTPAVLPPTEGNRT